MHSPPFEISSKTINLIAEISAQIERYAIRLENEGLKLRKANRIRTIHSSLAIEGNSLSEGQVRDIINGKNVVAPLRQIQEVKNAIKTYEFEFIHPFSDGNGRMGRLWQSLILGRLHPLFEHLPVENMVYSNQQAYYDVISESSHKGQCGVFIEFMLGEILATLKSHQGDEIDANVGINEHEHRIINLVSENCRLTIKEAALILSLSQRQAERLFASLKAKGVLSRQGSSKNGTWIINGSVSSISGYSRVPAKTQGK